jgi:hypothetical protein
MVKDNSDKCEELLTKEAGVWGSMVSEGSL